MHLIFTIDNSGALKIEFFFVNLSTITSTVCSVKVFWRFIFEDWATCNNLAAQCKALPFSDGDLLRVILQPGHNHHHHHHHRHHQYHQGSPDLWSCPHRHVMNNLSWSGSRHDLTGVTLKYLHSFLVNPSTFPRIVCYWFSSPFFGFCWTLDVEGPAYLLLYCQVYW